MIVSVATILFAAAITPGPNNLVVMDAARGGMRSAISPIAGVVLGTLGIVLAVRFGLGTAMMTVEGAEPIVRIIGAALLTYLAGRALIAGWRCSAVTKASRPDRALFLSMIVLQLVNPKTWVLATTVAATHAAQPSASLAWLVIPTATIPAACLLLWAAAGRSLGEVLERPGIKQGFAVLMATVLLAFAVALLLNPQ